VTSTLSVLSEVSPLDVVVSTLSVLSVVPVLAELSVLIGVSVVSVGSLFDVSSRSDVVLESEELTILELSVVRSEDFVAKSDESVVRPEDGLVSPEDSDSASEDTLVTSDDPLVRSRDPVVTSEDPVVRSDDGVVKPEESVAASEDSLVKAEESVIFDDSVDNDISVACSELISELLLLSVLSLVLSWPLTVVSPSLVCALPRLYAVSTSIGVSVSNAEIVKSPEPSTVLSITEVPLLGTLVSSWSPEPVIPVPSLPTGDAGASLSIKSSMERSVSFDHPGTVDSVLVPNLSSPIGLVVSFSWSSLSSIHSPSSHSSAGTISYSPSSSTGSLPVVIVSSVAPVSDSSIDLVTSVGMMVSSEHG
jgi:hypothetical protein